MSGVAYWPELDRVQGYVPMRPDYGLEYLLRTTGQQVMNDDPFVGGFFRNVAMLGADTFDFVSDERKLTADEANEKYGIPGRLVFTEPVGDNRASLMQQRKLAEMERENIIENSATWGRAPARLATSMAAFAMDPVNLVSMLIPFDKVRWIAPIVGGLENPIAKTVVTDVANNVIQQFAVEPFTLAAANYDGADYDLVHNSAVNIGMGAAFGLVIGAGRGALKARETAHVGSIRAAVESSARVLNHMSTQEQSDMMRVAILNVMRDEPIVPSEILAKSAPERLTDLQSARQDAMNTLRSGTATRDEKILAAALYHEAVERTRLYSADPQFDAKLAEIDRRLADIIEGRVVAPEEVAKTNMAEAEAKLQEHRARVAREAAEDAKRAAAEEHLRKEKTATEVEQRVSRADELIPGRPESAAVARTALVKEARAAINDVSPETAALVDKKETSPTPKLDVAEVKAAREPRPTILKEGETYSMLDTPAERTPPPKPLPSRVERLTVHNVHLDGHAPVMDVAQAEKHGLQKFWHTLTGGSRDAGILGGLHGYPIYPGLGGKKLAQHLHPGANPVGVNVKLYKVLDLTQTKDPPSRVLAEAIGYDLDNPDDLALLREAIAKDPDYVGNMLRKKSYDGLILEKTTALHKAEGTLSETHRGEPGRPSVVLLLGNRKVVVDKTRTRVRTEIRRAQYTAAGVKSEAEVVEALNRDLSRLLYEEDAEIYLCDKDGHIIIRLEEIQGGKYQGWAVENLEGQVMIDQEKIARLEARRAEILDARDAVEGSGMKKLQRERQTLEGDIEALESDAAAAREAGETVDADMLDKEIEAKYAALETLEKQSAEMVKTIEGRYDPSEARRLELEIEELKSRPRRTPGYTSPAEFDTSSLIGWLRKDGFFKVETNPTVLSLEESHMAKQAEKKTRGVRKLEEVVMATVRPEDERAALQHRASMIKLAKLYGVKHTRNRKYIGDVQLSKKLLQAEKRIDRLRRVSGGAIRDPMGRAMGDALAASGLTEAPLNVETRKMTRQQMTEEANKLLREALIPEKETALILPDEAERVDVAHVMNELTPEQRRQYDVDAMVADELDAVNAEVHEEDAMDLTPEQQRLKEDHLSAVDDPDYETMATFVESAAECAGKRLGFTL